MNQDNLLIGFDAKRIVANGTGLGSYGRNLINGLTLTDTPCRLRLYAPDEGREDLRSQVMPAPNLEWSFSGRSTRLGKDLWRAGGMVDDLKRDGVAIFHGLSGELPKGLRRAGIQGVVTIHDLIFMRHPEFYHRLDAWLYRRKFYRTLREADRIIAISECTKRDILYYCDYPEDRIDVVYQSCDRRFAQPVTEEKKLEVKRKYGLPDRFVLNVGTIERRKNVKLAVEALPQLPSDLHLVVVGRATPYAKEVAACAEAKGVEARVHLLHGVPNDDLIAIYRLASCFVYPSVYEGFGIPIIEAIQSGLPVVAATGSCLEEAGGPDCLYVSPDDAPEMASAILKAIDERDQRVERAREYVRKFENNNVAQQVLQVYRKLHSVFLY